MNLSYYIDLIYENKKRLFLFYGILWVIAWILVIIFSGKEEKMSPVGDGHGHSSGAGTGDGSENGSCFYYGNGAGHHLEDGNSFGSGQGYGIGDGAGLPCGAGIGYGHALGTGERQQQRFGDQASGFAYGNGLGYGLDQNFFTGRGNPDGSSMDPFEKNL